MKINGKECTGKALKLLIAWTEAKQALHEATTKVIEAQEAENEAEVNCAMAYADFFKTHYNNQLDEVP